MGYNMEGCLKNIEAIVETIDLFAINALWGNFAFDFAISPSVGYSGGLFCVWDPNTFSKESVTISDSFFAIRGESIILGDFNEVRAEHERFCTTFNEDGFDKLVEGSWKNLACEDSNNISLLKKKFQALKALIKDWCKEDNQRSKAARSAIQSCISEIDKFFDKGKGNEGLVIERTSLLKDLQDINARYSLDLAQKAKIWWSIEGDENSKYFQGIINKKLSQLAIRGVLHSGPKISFGHQMFKQLSDELKEILESNVTYEEIKKAVWDCGTNKSPGTDGFTFDFIRRYWKIMDQDVVNAVHEFFNSSLGATFSSLCELDALSPGDEFLIIVLVFQNFLSAKKEVKKLLERNNLTQKNSKNDVKESICLVHFKKYEVPKSGGSILQLIDDLVKVGETIGASVDNSGGILCVWDPNMFKKMNCTVSDYFVMVRGDWIPNGKKLLIISVYAPQELSEKKMLWDYLSLVMSRWEEEVVIMGDFNEVRNKLERFGTLFNRHGAYVFNRFISNAGRTEVVKLLQEVEKKNSLEAAQKAKIKWAIEGDENSKYYHGVINKKRNQLSIRGILVEGTWIDSPSLVKSGLVNEIQSAFVADKQILNGPFIFNELVQ
nr:RNA-directed DNA polymerase, eukaryota [Tanacetum cinerariifolium]